VASTDQQLMEIYRRLGPGDRKTLLAFAEFLGQRTTGPAPRAVGGKTAPVAVPEPLALERPAQESVVAGLKRLSKTYPMLDKSKMLSATSDLVATHIMQGTAAAEAIDTLEEIFREHYRQLQQGQDS
jgi:hypothetical protein